MKCELCHQADAQRAIRKLVNNEEQELYVCNACAQKQQAKKGKPAKHQKPPPEVMDVLKETLPEIMGMILGATVDFTGNIPSIKDPVCSLCGISRSEYKKAGRFGCAQCYETFVKDLDGVVGEMHRIPRHIGKAPKKPKPSSSISRLMDHLRTAMREQRTTEVEELQSRLRQLGWDPPSPEGQDVP